MVEGMSRIAVIAALAVAMIVPATAAASVSHPTRAQTVKAYKRLVTGSVQMRNCAKRADYYTCVNRTAWALYTPAQILANGIRQQYTCALATFVSDQAAGFLADAAVAYVQPSSHVVAAATFADWNAYVRAITAFNAKC